MTAVLNVIRCGRNGVVTSEVLLGDTEVVVIIGTDVKDDDRRDWLVSFGFEMDSAGGDPRTTRRILMLGKRR